MEAYGLDVPLNQIPFRKPVADIPGAIRTVCFTRAEDEVTCANASDPTGTRYGWTRILRVSDPRQWFTAGSLTHSPVDWGYWESLYAYFLVTGVKLWIRAHSNAIPATAASAFHNKYGAKFTMDLTTATSSSSYRADLVGPDQLWERGFFQNKKTRPVIRDWSPEEGYQLLSSGGGEAYAAQSHGASNMFKCTKSWDLMWYYKNNPGETAYSAAPPGMNYWRPTSTTIANWELAVPQSQPNVVIGMGANAGAWTNAIWYDILIQWDVVFAMPLPDYAGALDPP